MRVDAIVEEEDRWWGSIFGRSSLPNTHASLDVRYQFLQIDATKKALLRKYLPAFRFLHLNSQSKPLFEVQCPTPTHERLIPRRCTAEESPQTVITIIQAIKSYFTKLVRAVLAQEKGTEETESIRTTCGIPKFYPPRLQRPPNTVNMCTIYITHYSCGSTTTSEVVPCARKKANRDLNCPVVEVHEYNDWPLED